MITQTAKRTLVGESQVVRGAAWVGLQLSPVQRVPEPALGAIRLAKGVAG